ncbi:CAHS14 [Ramazzottius varieornatus]|uniref:CAHS14 n=1 Tax=Ramazzottius varieornatus TaxID=947166 RepID=A0A1D1VZY1_RAMVA|nr:CAHS14 [Ramazzottius varieornatus]
MAMRSDKHSTSSGANKEAKYERVEKIDVDKAGHTNLRDVREDRGGEDPALNFQDKRPAGLVPGAAVGMIPTQSSETEVRSASSLSSGRASDQYAGRTSSMSSHTSGSSTVGSHTHGSIRHDSASMDSGVASGGAGAYSYQRTEVTSTSGAGPRLGGLQRTVIVPPGPHSQIHEQTDIIRHKTATQSETHMIQVPVTTFGSTNMESVRTGYTVTEDKPLTIAAPVLAQPIHTRLDVQLGGGASAEIHAGTTVDLSAIQGQDLGPEEYARYRAKVEALAREDEREAGLRAAEYRTEVERDAETIRQILERQHIRDLEFRREMIEHQVDRQEREIQLEAEYAMRALEMERQAARKALETAKAQTHVDVRVDTAIGTTISKGAISTSAEKKSTSQVGPTTVTSTKTVTERSSTASRI